MMTFETNAKALGATYICGCDEAGRGCLAGPVVAAAVHIPEEHVMYLSEVFDSKQLSERKRFEQLELIYQYADVSYAIVEAEEIDRINIYEASRKAMLLSLRNLPYDYVLTDAMPLPQLTCPVEAIIKGDQKSLSIASASVVAKCVRDMIMYTYDELYPMYCFGKHKGYATKVHKAALAEHGILQKIHRLSYKPVQEVLIEQVTLF